MASTSFPGPFLWASHGKGPGNKVEVYKLLFLGHRSLIKKIVQTAVINIVFIRILCWDHFDILVSGKTDFHCKIKETLFI